MSGVNKAILVGRVGKDPEIKFLDNGNAIANFSVATSEKYKGEEQTEWHNITVFSKLAEIVAEYVVKGSLVYVEGKIVTRKWEKNGETKYSTGITAYSVQILSGWKDKEEKEEPKKPSKDSPKKPAQKQQQVDFDDDIPF